MIYWAKGPINDGSTVVSGLETEALHSKFHQAGSLSLGLIGLYSLFAQDALQQGWRTNGTRHNILGTTPITNLRTNASDPALRSVRARCAGRGGHKNQSHCRRLWAVFSMPIFGDEEKTQFRTNQSKHGNPTRHNDQLGVVKDIPIGAYSGIGFYAGGGQEARSFVIVVTSWTAIANDA
ncbi:hypothetical protein AVEN_90456-1 [Araneus ventricosus]|uniref:Uncharacterized protein n=1 Tax=Araneus ventricosus TaxID=182803 RepID=A0A4Y2USH4_ARAVE|nr:hypothetical protein AVEN_90456-1 [Araneus ventricosus]